MAFVAISLGVVNVLFGFLELSTVGFAAWGFLFGSCGLLCAAASLPAGEVDITSLSSVVKLGLVLPVVGLIVSVITGLCV